MCGITGIYAFNEIGRISLIHLPEATRRLAHRGPDAQQTYTDYAVGLGHCRLSVIDLSPAANQPFSDEDKQYHVVFNGEIYNYQQLRQELTALGFGFRTQSDTEVLLQGYRAWGRQLLERLEGFFAFAIYHSPTKSLFIARDRFGIKPLYYYLDEDKLLFASELTSLVAYGIPRHICQTALITYLQLNYVPPPLSMLQGVRQLPPGHWLHLQAGSQTPELQAYYKIEDRLTTPPKSYRTAQAQLFELMEQAVAKRLVADVPVGTFLSGGIDSSVVTAIAASLKPGIEAFSVSFPQHRFFDESHYAQAVAQHCRIQLHTFRLHEYDLLQELDNILQHFDEPFADSSAIAVYMISRFARSRVKVILSGDGADEVFGGYRKHLAVHYAQQYAFLAKLLKPINGLVKHMPQHRGGWLPDRLRQLNRFLAGMQLAPAEQYWLWASLASLSQATALLHSSWLKPGTPQLFAHERDLWLEPFHVAGNSPLQATLLSDMRMVLAGDMLKKVDHMSMAHALEVRVPFLDHRLVEFAFSLPTEWKIGNGMRKRIVQDAFRHILPAELYRRPKQGFEVPLLAWLRGPLHERMQREWLNDELIISQGVFCLKSIQQLKQQLHSQISGDTHARLWAIIVFQLWWKRIFGG